MTFLEKYLLKWRPPQNQQIILDLLSYLPLESFSGKSPTPEHHQSEAFTNPSPPNHPPHPSRKRSPQRPTNPNHQPPRHPPSLLHHPTNKMDRPSPLRPIPPATPPDNHPPLPNQPHNPPNANPPRRIPHRIHHLPHTNLPLHPAAPGRAPPIDTPPPTTAPDNLPHHLPLPIPLVPVPPLLAPHELETRVRSQRRHGPGPTADRIVERGLDGHMQPAVPLPGVQCGGRSCVGLPDAASGCG